MNTQKLIARHFKRCALAFALVTVLAACSIVGALYQNATSLAMLEIDRYFDLNREQETAGKLRTEALMAWHRREVLPLYVKQLRGVASKVEQGFNSEQVGEVLTWGTGELRRVSDYALPQQAELLTSLSDQQITYFQKKMAKDNAKYRKQWLDSPREEALELRFDQLMTWVERIYGDLTQEQKKRIRALSDARAFEPQTAYNERLARQAQLLALIQSVVKNKDKQANAQALIANFISDLEKTSPHTHLARKELVTLIAAISQIANSEQRLNAKNTLLEYAATFEGLSRGR